MEEKNICVIDYKLGGNIFNVLNALESIGAKPYLSSDAQEINQAKKVLFPGVGSFSQSMGQINKLGLVEVIKEKALSGIPFLGICVGMQVMFEEGTESSNGSCKGLGIFKGIVDKFAEKADLKIPHMGWNRINTQDQSPLLKGITEDERFYFVHSFKANKLDKELNPGAQFAFSDYGEEFISHIWNGKNLFAAQFHPEKSGSSGLKFLQNFVEL